MPSPAELRTSIAAMETGLTLLRTDVDAILRRRGPMSEIKRHLDESVRKIARLRELRAELAKSQQAPAAHAGNHDGRVSGGSAVFYSQQIPVQRIK